MTSEQAHILIVDDDARLRGLLSRFLGEQGFRITTAENADDARDKLRFLDFDLMVLDVMMPGGLPSPANCAAIAARQCRSCC
jgi:two-component system phosphate regulon response regulator OmpR